MKRIEKELHIVEDNYRRVKDDYCKTQAELVKSAEREAKVQKEFTEKERELCNDFKEVLNEKNELLTSMDVLQKKLEAVCLDVGCKEQANKKLSEEIERLQEQVSNGVPGRKTNPLGALVNIVCFNGQTATRFPVKIGRYAALAILMNHHRQNLAKRIIQYISVKRASSPLTCRLSDWPKYGGCNSPKQLKPRSDQSSSLNNNRVAI